MFDDTTGHGTFRPVTWAYAFGVAAHIINGDRWIAERLASLRALLEGDLTEDDRRAVEYEIALLSKERGMIAAGLRVPRLLRRFRRTN